MTSKTIYTAAQMHRKSALRTLQSRKEAGEAVGRVHTLPALAASEVEALFETAFTRNVFVLHAA